MSSVASPPSPGPAGTMDRPGADLRLRVCGMYWYFVVAVWPVIYGLVYH